MVLELDERTLEMSRHHGAVTAKEWMDDLIELARSGTEMETRAGAEPGRRYAYLEWHDDEKDLHSILVFHVEIFEGELGVRTYRFEGTAQEVRERMDALVHYHS